VTINWEHIFWKYKKSWIVNFKFNMKNSIKNDLRLYENPAGADLRLRPAWKLHDALEQLKNAEGAPACLHIMSK
jgi:hypothetical protein